MGGNNFMTPGIFTPVQHSEIRQKTIARADKTNGSPNRRAGSWKTEAITEMAHEMAEEFMLYQKGRADTNGTLSSQDQSSQYDCPDAVSSPLPCGHESGGSSLWGGLKSILPSLSRLLPFSSAGRESVNSPSSRVSFPLSKKRKRSSFESDYHIDDDCSVNTCDSTLGACIIISSDDFFAPAINLLNPAEPKFDPNEYGPYGKIMDGWETRRRREPGHNWCIIRLAAPTYIKRIEVSTRHFTGNYVPRISLEACRGVGPGKLESWLGDDYPPSLIDANNHQDRTGQGHYVDEGEEFLHDLEEKMRCDDENGLWHDIVPIARLKPGTEDTHLHTFCPVELDDEPVTYLRLNQFPDGGIARLKVFGAIARPTDVLPSGENFAGLLNGACVISFSSAHFSHPNNLLLPNPPQDMSSGWETARQLCRPGRLRYDPDNPDDEVIDWGECQSEWVIIRLAQRMDMQAVTINTQKFIGNPPDTINLEAVDAAAYGISPASSPTRQAQFFRDNPDCWDKVLMRCSVSPDSVANFDLTAMKLRSKTKPIIATHVRLSVMPDGGIARLGIYGKSDPREALMRRARIPRKD